MAQAGIHGMIGLAVHKWVPDRQWLMLGVVLGNLFPDADNLAVAVATVANLPTEGLHRTLTHSILFVAAIVLIFYAIARIARRPRWGTLGLGLGIGVLMHILLDLLVWFDGVEILWPIPSWINLWGGFTPPEWWSKLMMPAEFLFFALFRRTVCHGQSVGADEGRDHFPAVVRPAEIQGAGEAEVSDFGDACFGYQHVGGFDVLVNHPIVMGRSQAPGELNGDIEDLAQFQQPVIADPVCQ